MKKVSIFLAEGFEEVEALTPADVLRRAGAEVTLVAVGGKREVAGSHGIIITADRLFEDMDFADMDLLLLPGVFPLPPDSFSPVLWHLPHKLSFPAETCLPFR